MASYSKYWEEQELKQMGMGSMIEQSETKPDPKYGEPALEETLNNVKKTLWDVERHTHDTQSRLDKNNQSGPSHPLYKIAKWADNKWILDMISETLVEIQDTIENSAIARHSYSPLETLLAAQHKEQEKWNISAGGSFLGTHPTKSPLIDIPQGAGTGSAIPKETTNYLKEIAENTKEALERIPFKEESAEDKMESEARAENRERDLKAYRKTIKGKWNAFLKWGKESWIGQNWKLILAGLFLLFAPFKVLKPLWIGLKAFWKMDWYKKIFTLLGLWFAWTKLKGGIASLTKLWKGSVATRGVAGTLGHMAGTAKAGLSKGVSALGGATKVIGGASLLAGVAMAIKDGFAGAKLSEEWGVGKASGVAGAVLGGTSKGLEGAMANMGKWALIGAGIGSFVPVIGTLIGGVIGAVVGAVLGWVGGEKIAQGFSWVGDKFTKLWDKVTEGLGLMAEDFKVYLIDPLINFFGGLKDWASNAITSMLPKKILDFFGLGGDKVDESIKPAGPSGGLTADEEKTRVAKGQKTFAEFLSDKPHGKVLDPKTGEMKSSSGAQRRAYQAFLKKGGGTTAPTDTGTTAPTDAPAAGIRPDAVATKRLAQYRKNPSRYKRKMKMGLEGTYGDALRSQMTDKELKRFGGSEDKHKAVKVSGANMSGVAWNKLGGKDTIEDAILTTWNQAGVSGAPTFTSGLRKKDAKESLANPRSQHIQGTAFDLRSKDLGSKGPAVFADIKEKFAGMGLWGQWEKGNVNAKNRSGEHFHFQLAAKGFGGVVNKATGFIAGEEGPELVNIVPLQSPADKTNAINQVHADRATLGNNQASPTIIATESTNNNVQSNPLTYVSGTSSARGKPIPTSRGS